MITEKKVWSAAQAYGGVSIPYSPTTETGIYEIILPTTDHKRQCCIYVTDTDAEPIPEAVVRTMRTVSDNRYRVVTAQALERILKSL